MNACHVPRRGRLGSFDFAEKLGEDPDEVVVVDGAEDFGNKGAALCEELDGEFEGHEHELALGVRVLDPGRTDVRRTVVQDDVCLPVLELVPDEVPAVRGGDICGEGDNAGDGLDGYQVNT